MPPKYKFTKNEIIKAALDITRMGGISALTARALADKLGCSVKPIFGLFESMGEVKSEVIKAADELFQRRMNEEMSLGEYPPYKASGMAYIHFAKDERELFKLLFMRDRTATGRDKPASGGEPLIKLISNNLGVDTNTAGLLHLEMWTYVHGIAAMIATSYLDWDDELVSRVLTDAYEGLKYRHTSGK